MRWKRIKRGMYSLQGINHVALIAKAGKSDWEWGVFQGTVDTAEGILMNTAINKAYAKHRSQQRLLELEPVVP
jgi:hypothetical protein